MQRWRHLNFWVLNTLTLKEVSLINGKWINCSQWNEADDLGLERIWNYHIEKRPSLCDFFSLHRLPWYLGNKCSNTQKKKKKSSNSSIHSMALESFMEIMTDTTMIIKTKLNTYSLVLRLSGNKEEPGAYLSCPNYVFLVINITFPGYISQLICFSHTNRILYQRCKFIVLLHFFFRF